MNTPNPHAGVKTSTQGVSSILRRHGINELNELTGRDLYLYRTWRREGNGDGRDPIKRVTLKGQLTSLRRFLRFVANIDAVPAELYEQVTLPTMSNGEDVSSSTLEADRALEILDYLEHAQPGSRDHIIVLLLWKTGARTGAVRGLDLRDLDSRRNAPARIRASGSIRSQTRNQYATQESRERNSMESDQ